MVVVARHPVLADGDVRHRVAHVLAGEVTGVPLDEIEPPPAEPDVVLHPVQPLLDVVAHPIWV